MIRCLIFIVLLIWIPVLMGAQSSVQRYDVVITELMPDPSPVVSLPNAEYVEIRNNSHTSINLAGWKLVTPSAASGSFPSYNLQPDSFLILSSTSSAATFQLYGRTIGVPSFPSLPNEGTVLSLMSKDGRTIHAVNYDAAWYHNDVKKEGGWSLEMIDLTIACSGKGNWKAAVDVSGGTPGQRNSVAGSVADKDPPRLVRTFCPDSVSIMLLFDKTLDSSIGAVAGNYRLESSSTAITAAFPQPPLFSQVLLKLNAALSPGRIHELTVSNLQDCSGNAIGGFNQAKVGLAQSPGDHDLVINEILFNPKPGGFDYVEIFNPSKKIIDLSRIFLGNRTSACVVSSLKRLAESGRCLFPGEFLVANEEAVSLMNEYVVKWPEQVLALPSLPSYPDDKGCVILADATGRILDEVNYSEKWHFALITNAEGVALERIDPTKPSDDPGNWHSASSTSGYGTPTAVNSQHHSLANAVNEILVEPKLFSPDNDGFNDIASINYNFHEAGYLANITIFNSNGYVVRYLVKNNLLGFKGHWLWDGLDEQKKQLASGAYIVYVELFDLQGHRRSGKYPVTIAGKSSR